MQSTTQPLLTTSPLEPDTEIGNMDVSGSGSGSGSLSHSESEDLGSGDLEKEIVGSGLEEFDNKEGDGATLRDDEDFSHLTVAGGAAAKRRRRRSLVRLYGSQRDRHINHKANIHDLMVGERAQSEKDADHGIVPLPIKDRDVSDSEIMVFEYNDRYDSRADMLKFER